jgi:hypothetical protein
MSDNILEKKVDSYDHLLEETNDLLVRVGISSKKISSIEELSRVSSSMFVAVYESLFRTRLEGINRNPQTKEEYTSNVQIVIDELSDQIQIDLKHINGEDIANGDVRTISNLLRIFARIFNVTRYSYLFTSSTCKQYNVLFLFQVLMETIMQRMMKTVILYRYV